MGQKINISSIKNLFYVLGGLAGINVIILIHEMGHFFCAKLFNVPTPFFSLGFGPALIAYPIGQTVFKLALFPFGGYVEMDPAALASLAYLPKMLIVSAGILFNFIFTYIILLYYTLRNQNQSSINSMKITLKNMSASISETIKNKSQNQRSAIIGPIGIIAIIGKILATDPQLYWFILAILSLNIGLFNILPLPFFDGGKALIFTIEAITGTPIPTTLLWTISTIILILFALCITRITINDIKQLRKK